MAKSLQFGRSIDIGSDQIPDNYCEPCYENYSEVKAVAGYCKDCSENLCVACFSSHRGSKLFRRHQLVDKSTRPKTKSTPQIKPQTSTENCLLHTGEPIQSFCQQHSQLCCKVCIKINHQSCQTEELSKVSRNIQASQELTNLNEKLEKLKKGFNENLSKTGANELVIQKNHSDAIKEMNKLQDEFDKLMTETKNQADKIKEDNFNSIENISDTCNIVIDQIVKMESNLDTLKKKGENDNLFISMKRVESQIQSLEESLEKLDKENTVREYQFEPEEKLKSIFTELKVLGHLSVQNPRNIPTSVSGTDIVNISEQKEKKPVHVKDIHVQSSTDKDFNMFGSVALPNNQVLITDWNNKKVKLIESSQNKIVSEIKLPNGPFDITQVTQTDFAVSLSVQQRIQFLSLTHQSLALGREMSVNGSCRGLAYNSRDQTFIVTYDNPAKIEVLNMSGVVIRIKETDKHGSPLFKRPFYVALSPCKGEMYVSDSSNHNVTLMTLTGDVKTIYTDKGLTCPEGIFVHKSGLVYVAGYGSHSVHQLDPDSGELKLILGEKDGLQNPWSISYCESEDKMYIGMGNNNVLKVFQMK